MLGACIICIDPLIRLLPGQKRFKLQENNAFLSSSLSLSFGVMVCLTLRIVPESAFSNI
jgi:zinc transporter, ZIP family